jgi:hypothetical protein
MPHIAYDQVLDLVTTKFAEHGILKSEYLEDPIALPIRWSPSMLKVEQSGIKDGSVVVVQMFFEFAECAGAFRSYTRVTSNGCAVNMLRDVVVMVSRPDFECDNEALKLDLGGFNLLIHRRMPKTIAARVSIDRQANIEAVGQWIDKAITGGIDTLLKCASMYTLISAVVDEDAADIFVDESEAQVNA